MKIQTEINYLKLPKDEQYYLHTSSKYWNATQLD